MRLEEEIEALRRRLDALARDDDGELIARYALNRPPMPPGAYWRLRWLAGSVLRWIRSMPGLRSDPWPVGLRHAAATRKARPLVIWAVGADRDTLREACDGFARLEASLTGFAPVLITDVSDFAFFSRLGWLVEYLPQLGGEGESYDERKMRFLARLYHGAPALPVSAGLAVERHEEDIRRLVLAR